MMILGLDPGFATLGYSLVSLTSTGELVRELGVIKTEKSGKKREVRASDDNVRRAREIYDSLKVLTSKIEPVCAICAEAMSFPRQASVAAKVAMCWGVIASIAVLRNIPILQASPQEVKKLVTGNKSASKEDVQAALKARYPGPPVDSPNPSFPATQAEHPYDALGAVVACLESDVIRMARQVVG
jgi:crossover junction endodeoxyribonuclease RuvC